MRASGSDDGDAAAKPGRQRHLARLLGSHQAARVTALAVFTSFIGMLLVDKGFPPATVVIGGCIGIALLAGASFAMNCLLEAAVDARMKRTDWRPSAQGD